MLRQLFGFSSIALLSGLSILLPLTTSVRAQANPQAGTKVDVINISKVERRPLGGHKAKATYKVTLPDKFSLKKIDGTVVFKLIGGKTQTGNFSIDNPKLEDTIEVAALGQLLSVDQQPDKVEVKIKATAEKVFNGSTSANFSPTGTLNSQSDAFDLNIDIPQISNFKRQALGGHEVRVHYKTPSVPTGFTAKKLLVTATFNLNDGKTQTETVSRENNIALNGSELIDTAGKVLRKEGEVTGIATKVEIKGIVKDAGEGFKSETCTNSANCIN